MAIFDFNPFNRAKKKQSAKKATSKSKAEKLAENKARKSAALKRAAEKRKNPRTDLPGSSTGPKKKTQAERDKALRTNRQKAKNNATTPAKAPAKPKAKAPAKKASTTSPAKKVTGTAPRFGVGNNKTRFAKRGKETKELANVTADQLKATGLTLRQYMNEWNRTGKRPTKKSKPPMASKAKKQMSNFEAGRKKAMAPRKTVGGGYTSPERKR